MGAPVYTHATWRVREGNTDAFIEAWTELSAVFTALARLPVGTGTLIQSVVDPLLFFSFGRWSSADDVAAMRAEPAARAAISPGLYRIVREVDPAGAGGPYGR